MVTQAGHPRPSNDEMMTLLTENELRSGHDWWPLIFGETPVHQTLPDGNTTKCYAGVCPGVILNEPVSRPWLWVEDRIFLSHNDWTVEDAGGVDPPAEVDPHAVEAPPTVIEEYDDEAEVWNILEQE